MSKQLHIVMHDVPWPADFGGVVDLYYKLKWLHAFGVKIQLHCFVHNRPQQPELNKYCEAVHYYERKKRFGLRLPYIVSSRIDKKLLENLAKDDHPILLEGIHCSYLLYADSFPHRKIFLRLHNVEFLYYGKLAGHETNWLKKFYYGNEARLLKKYEQTVATKAPVWAVSTADVEVYRNVFGAADIHFLPVFLPWDRAEPRAGTGSFCLYHGNLEINENETAALWLIENIFAALYLPFVIAGKNPSKKLKTAAASYKHISIVDNPPEHQMQELIAEAHVNILPSFNNTGVKLKLLNALYNGRHCLVNLAGCEGSGVNEACVIAETAEEFKEHLQKLFQEEFTENKIQHRNAVLKSLYNNEQNARRINAWIW